MKGKVLACKAAEGNSVNNCIWLVWIIGMLYIGMYNRHYKLMEILEPIYLEGFIPVLPSLQCAEGVYVEIISSHFTSCSNYFKS